MHLIALLTNSFQRSILEADQDEITEEDGDMNDDELNELIARHKSEVAIFHEMDIQREKDALESWRARGKRGNPPPPLMPFEELPECYQTDEPFDIKDVEDLVEGRGQRRRNIVSYNDGLSDDAWAMVCFSIEKKKKKNPILYSQALEDGEDIEELSASVKDKRGKNKLLKENDTSGRGTPASEVDGRGRKPKKGKAKVNDYENTGPSGSKRKRGIKSRSLTPEGDDEDEGEGHNTVGFNYQLKRVYAR